MSYRLVVFKRYPLSTTRHARFKETQRAIERRQERSFVRRIKTYFVNH